MKDYQSVLIVYNPNALKGKISEYIPKIKQRLSLRFSVVDNMATPETGAEAIAYKYATKYDIIVSCGGDGTFHEIANGVKKANADTVIAVLPFGTCNDVAHTLGIPKNLDKAIDCILRFNTAEYDLIYDGKDYITYTLAAGYLTNVSYTTSKAVKRKIGRLAYVLEGIKDLFTFRALPMTINYDGVKENGKYVYLMLMNSKYIGGFKVNPHEHLDNKKVKLVAIKKGFWSLFTYIKMFLFGVNSIKKSKCAIVCDVSSITVENHANETFTMDGEMYRFLYKTFSAQQSITVVNNR